MTKTLTKATEYQVATQDPQEVLDLISEELAGETLDEFSLDRVKVPAGGGNILIQNRAIRQGFMNDGNYTSYMFSGGKLRYHTAIRMMDLNL